MFIKQLHELREEHPEPFDVEETPLVDALYSITRPTKAKDGARKPGAALTPAQKREAARKWLEETPPVPLPQPQLPKGMARPWRGPKPTPLPVRRPRGG